MNRRFLIQTPAALSRALQELSVFPDGPVHEIVLRPYERKLSSAQQSIAHSMIRDIVNHAVANNIPATEDSVKEQMKANHIEGIEWPGEWKQGFGGDAVWVPRGTMDLTAKQCGDLIDQIGAFGSSHGVSWSQHDTLGEDAA